jgi:hypothetical protein
VGEEEAEEDRVMSVRRLHGERVGDLVPNVGPISRARSVEREHLGRRIGDQQLIGRLGQDPCPQPRARCQLEHATAWRSCPERGPDPIRMGR